MTPVEAVKFRIGGRQPALIENELAKDGFGAIIQV